MKPITKITKHWPVQKILDEVPGSVDCMIEAGLDCFACNSDKSETLEEGMKSHGLSDEDVLKMVDEINKSWQSHRMKQLKKPKDSDFTIIEVTEGNKVYYKIGGLMLTQKAHQAILQLKPEGKNYIKILLEAGGCSGYSYEYSYTDSSDLEDGFVFRLDDSISLLTNLFTFNKLLGSVIDFESGLQGSGLVFHNPNSKQNCHCGVSVNF